MSSSSVKLSPEAADQQSKLATQKALFELGKQTANKEQSINERVKRELEIRQKINNIKSDLNEHPNTRFSKEITDKIDPFEKLIKIQEDNIDSLMKQLSQLHEENNESVEIKPGDILIGKITPKGESDPTPEEKLLRAIFGDKAGDVKDASLKASPSLHGVVIEKKLFSRAIKDKRKRAQDKEDIAALEDAFDIKFDDLKSVDGIEDNIAKKIYNYFHE